MKRGLNRRAPAIYSIFHLSYLLKQLNILSNSTLSSLRSSPAQISGPLGQLLHVRPIWILVVVAPRRCFKCLYLQQAPSRSRVYRCSKCPTVRRPGHFACRCSECPTVRRPEHSACPCSECPTVRRPEHSACRCPKCPTVRRQEHSASTILTVHFTSPAAQAPPSLLSSSIYAFWRSFVFFVVGLAFLVSTASYFTSLPGVAVHVHVSCRDSAPRVWTLVHGTS